MINQGLDEQVPGTLLDFIQMTSQRKAILDGQGVSHSLPAVTANGITVASTGVIYLPSFVLPRNVTFGWEVKFSSVGTIDAKVELEQGFQRPTTEGASDTTWVSQDNKLTTNMLFQEISNSAYHMTAYSPNATPMGRLKVTGLGSNDAATLLAVAKVYMIKNNQL